MDLPEIPDFRHAGDRYLLVELGRTMDLDSNFCAHGLSAAIHSAQITGVVDIAPCFASILVEYDQYLIEPADLIREITCVCSEAEAVDRLHLQSRLITLPAAYLDPWTRAAIEVYSTNIRPRGYDPDEIAALNGLIDSAQFVRVHSGTEYWVAAIGSWPGLPFLMPLDPRCRLTAPKYSPPRTFTPQGAIGLGGSSTAIYSVDSPGGYQLFARTPVPIWSHGRKSKRFSSDLVLLRPGDRVRFVPVSTAEYEEIAKRIETDEYADQVIEYQNFSVAKYRTWVATLNCNERF